MIIESMIETETIMCSAISKRPKFNQIFYEYISNKKDYNDHESLMNDDDTSD